MKLRAFHFNNKEVLALMRAISLKWSGLKEDYAEL